MALTTAVATIWGVIIGPHCLNWFAPDTWGNLDNITIEVSRIVLVVQIFAVAVELPKKYMLKHWLSVVILLLPVMTFGWLLSSVFIWKLVPTLRWVEALAIAACVTATDPVLASAVVGKGKFAQRVPGHLRNLLSAESGCNDGMAFPFAYLAINLINHAGHQAEIAKDFIVITVLYECVFGCILGAIIGYGGRHLIKFAELHNLIDRESFLVFYFVLALFCTGVGSIIGTDDLLVAFAAGTAFSWDGWFSRKTEESHVSNVIDLLLNMAYFVYFGSIVPWEKMNDASLGISAWKLVIIAILILIFRRLPIMLAVKPFVPDIRTWREALFCGHFGPIGVGAVFISILVRAELEHGEPTPLAEIPPPGSKNYYVVATIWPITTFLVVASIVVHGSSIAVFTLGKRLNNMTITMTYTTAGDQPSWLSRLPRLENGRSFSLHRTDTDTTGKFKISTGEKAKPAGGMRKRAARRRSGAQDPENVPIDLGAGRRVPEAIAHDYTAEEEERINPEGGAAYQEGHNYIIEDRSGEVIAQLRDDDTGKDQQESSSSSATQQLAGQDDVDTTTPVTATSGAKHEPVSGVERHHRPRGERKPYQAYWAADGNEIIIENLEGEIVRRYRINRHDRRDDQARRGSIWDQTLALVGVKRNRGDETADNEQPNLEPARSPRFFDNDGDAERQNAQPGDLTMLETNGEHLDEEILKKRMREFIRKGPDGANKRSEPQSKDTEGPATTDTGLGAAAGTTSQATAPVAVEKLPDTHEQADSGIATTAPSRLPADLASHAPRNFLARRPEDEDDAEVDPLAPVPGETEVERKRRLAALGVIKDDDDDDEEEDEVRYARGSTHSPPPEQQAEAPQMQSIHWNIPKPRK